MGNWTTVQMIGKCDSKDIPALKNAVCIGDDWDKFHCLAHTMTSLCGLNNWVSEDINKSGNLSERDYDADDVAEVLSGIIKTVPSLTLKVHIGGDHESLDCVATVTCESGEVSVGEPEIKTLPKMSEAEMMGNMSAALRG